MLVGYARVSTRDQTPELQIGALRGAGCEKIFTETASGAGGHRPEFDAALEYVRPGDTLVVWKLDRLARSLRSLVRTVQDLAEHDVGFRSLTETIDTTSAGGRLVFHIFSALAEFERELTRERTMAGLDAARERGHRPGRPSKLGEKELREAEALLRDPKIRVVDVAARLGVSPSTLYRHFPGARTIARLNNPDPTSDDDRNLLIDYLIAPPHWEDDDDTVPDSVSETIGTFILHLRTAVPDDVASTDAWRATIDAAIPTSRRNDPHLYEILKNWLFAHVLPLGRPIADAIGQGTDWQGMLASPSYERCRQTMSTLNAHTRSSYERRAYHLTQAAQDAAEMFPQPPYPAEGHRMGAWSVSNVVGHIFNALVAHQPAATPAEIWPQLEADQILATLTAAA